MAGSPTRVLASLAQLSPDSDKKTVLATIDAAVDDLLDQLQSHPSGALERSFLQQTQQTIVFLEACTGFPDPTFTEHARRRMIELQSALLAATSNGDASGDRAAAAPRAEDDYAEAEPTEAAADNRSFEEIFADSLCKFVLDRFALFQINNRPVDLLDRHDGLMPYPLSSEFAHHLEEAIRTYIIRPILESRNMKIFAGGLTQQDMTEAHMMNVFSLPKRENVVRTLWTTQWDIVRAALRSQQSAQSQAAKRAQPAAGRGKQQSLLGRMFAKKAKTASKAPPRPISKDNEIGLEIWSTITEQPDAEYDPPLLGEIGLFDAIFDYNVGAITKRKVAVEQLLRQEVGESEGREGSSRLYMSRMIMELPPHCGELIALWAYYEHQDYFSPEVLKGYLASQATSEDGRRAALPLFLRWVPDPIGKGEE